MAKLNLPAGQWILDLTVQSAEIVGGVKPLKSVGARTLADWGFQNGLLHRQSLAADMLNFNRPMAAFDAADEIDFGQLVSLKDPNGRSRFVGRRLLVPGQAAGTEESKNYSFAGPWYWFERLVYHQSWNQLLITGALVPRQTSHLLLNLGGLSVGAQISAVAQYAIDQGAPFQLGILDVPVVPIVTEITDQTCAQIVIDQLRWAPDAVAWFDYATNPPTFHCRQKANLAAVTLALGAEQIPTIADEGLNIAARPDLQIPAVAFRYERTDTLNGVEYLGLRAEDIAPPGATGRELNALSATIPLAGVAITTISADVLCEDIDPNSVDWWKRVLPRLADERIKNLEILPNSIERVLQGSRTPSNLAGNPSSALPRFLVEGQLIDWMKLQSGEPVIWEQEEISAKFTYEVDVDATSGVKLHKVPKDRIAVHLVSTTAPAGASTYSRTKSVTEAESLPIGLAQYLYDALSGLEYEGSLNTTEQECSGYVGPGNTLNLAGTAVAAHTSMLARVQAVDEDIDRGQTRVHFGPTPALSLSAILELLRASRHRRRWTAESVPEDGKISPGATAQLGEATANTNSVSGDKQRSLLAVLEGAKKIESDVSGNNHSLLIQSSAAPGVYIQAQLDSGEAREALAGAGGSVNIRTADCFYLSVPRNVSIRAVKSCDPSDPPGSNWVRLVLCSDRIRIS